MKPHSIIDAQDLAKIYQMGSTEVPALQGVSLLVEPGEMVAIMGASGSGKSTLMNILGCLDRPTSGRYLLDGTRVDELGRSRLAQIRNERIGFVFQTFNLLPRSSAIENVELPLLYNRSGIRTSAQARATAALERVGLADRMEHEPSELSGGQQQCRLRDQGAGDRYPLLLADEPTGNLDTQTSLEVMALFQELNREGTTMILVTHEHDIAAYARRIIELRDGRIVRDEGVAARRDAAADLARVPPADEGSVS